MTSPQGPQGPQGPRTREEAYQRAAAAAKQLQEERERLGIPRYREDRPDDAQMLADRERENLFKQGRYSEYLASIKAELQAMQLAERGEEEEEEGDGDEGEQLSDDGDGEEEEDQEARRQYAYSQLAVALAKQTVQLQGQLNRLVGLVKQFHQIVSAK